MFERPYVDASEALAAVDTDAHRSLAATIARKSLVLLRNDGVLPLGPAPGTIAVIGPNADEVRNLFGDYSYPAHIESLAEMGDAESPFDVPLPADHDLRPVDVPGLSILEALKATYGDAVRYARGCAVNDDDISGFAEAVELAAASDIVVLVVGDKAGLTESCTSGEGRDRSSLALPGVQEDLARAVLSTGTPVVTVLVVGRPCGSEELHERSAAVLLAWLPGQEGGPADRRDARGVDQSRREAADVVPPVGRPAPGLLRPQGVRRQVTLARRIRRRPCCSRRRLIVAEGACGSVISPSSSSTLSR